MIIFMKLGAREYYTQVLQYKGLIKLKRSECCQGNALKLKY